MPRLPLRLVALVSAGLLTLTACGSDDSDSTDDASSSAPSSDGTSASTDGGAGTTVEGTEGSYTVSGAYGEKPEVTVDGTFATDETSTTVLSEGDGPVVKPTDSVTVDYEGVSGMTGEVFDSSFGKEPVTFPLNQVIAGFKDGLTGQKLGSRVAISVAPADGYPEGTPDGSVPPGDSLIFVVDLQVPPNAGLEDADPSATETYDGATGSVTVVGSYNQVPEVTVDGELTVDQTSAEVITKGDGPVVEAGADVLVNYVGVNGRTGKVFDSSFTDAPTTFGLDEVIPGFTKGLEGQTVGSRVAILVSPADGYPDGIDGGAIKAGDSLVFVVDLLDPDA